MDKLKQVPHITIKSAKPITDIPEPKLSVEFLDTLDNFVRNYENQEVDFLIDLLNRHGIPITKENFTKFVGVLEIRQIPSEDFEIENRLILFEGKPLCGYKRITKIYTDENNITHADFSIEESNDIVIGRRKY